MLLAEPGSFLVGFISTSSPGLSRTFGEAKIHGPFVNFNAAGSRSFIMQQLMYFTDQDPKYDIF